MASRALGVGGLCGLTCLLALACGPDSKEPQSTGTAGNQTAGASGSSAAGTAGAAGGSNAAGTGGSAANAGSSTGGSATGGTSSGGAATSGATGTVQIGRLLNTSTGGMQVTAWFQTKDAVSTSDCTHETFGDCSVSTCTANDKTATPPPNAGTITITDGAMFNVTLTAAPGQPYTTQAGATGSIVGAELVSVSAAGGDVPAFMTSIAVPRVITLSAPALDESGVGTVPASGDLVLTFDNRAADGETETKLHVLQSSGLKSNLYCQLPTESGTATIPGAALDKVRGAGGQLLLLVARAKQVPAGDFAVNVIAFMSAMNTAKSKAAVFKF
jgi:hypothetical protein